LPKKYSFKRNYSDAADILRDAGGIFVQLIHEREGFAPAVFADVASDHLAGFRTFEQRAVATAINAVWRVLILRLFPPERRFASTS
jgi:hypothetical protein